MGQLLTRSRHEGTVSTARPTRPPPPPRSLKPGPGGPVTVRLSDLNPARPTHREQVHPVPLRVYILPIPASLQPPGSVHVGMERQTLISHRAGSAFKGCLTNSDSDP